MQTSLHPGVTLKTQVHRYLEIKWMEAGSAFCIVLQIMFVTFSYFLMQRNKAFLIYIAP